MPLFQLLSLGGLFLSYIKPLPGQNKWYRTKKSDIASPFIELMCWIYTNILLVPLVSSFSRNCSQVLHRKEIPSPVFSLYYVHSPSDLRIFGFFRNLHSSAYVDLRELSCRKVQPQAWLLLNKEVVFLFILFPLPAFCCPQAF